MNKPEIMGHSRKDAAGSVFVNIGVNARWTIAVDSDEKILIIVYPLDPFSVVP